jgi:hypothetical protein
MLSPIFSAAVYSNIFSLPFLILIFQLHCVIDEKNREIFLSLLFQEEKKNIPLRFNVAANFLFH